MIAVHGFTGLPGHWRLAAEFLNLQGYTVVAPLLPGHGTKPADLERHGASDWLQAVVEAVLSVSDHRRVHLAGLSMGGLLALLAAGPTNAASITTINAPLAYRRKALYLAPVIHHFRPFTPWPPSPPFQEDSVADLALTYPGFPTRLATDLIVISRHARRAARRLRRPALIIQSILDETARPSSGPALARLLGPGTQTLWLSRSRHNALLDLERSDIHAALLLRLTTA